MQNNYSMILFPTAKLNLGLQITAKRTDGYHNIQTVFYQFPLKDVLEIVEDSTLVCGKCVFKSTGLPIPVGENLCVRAYNLLNVKIPLPGVRIHLHKIIPMGAGLGGGSSDAAYTLSLLNILFKLNLSVDELREFALELGSDCPLFIESEVQYAEGRGEVLTKINLNLKGMHLLVINPNIHISTAEAFVNIKSSVVPPCKVIIEQDISAWKQVLVNDFEASIFPTYPELKVIKDKLYALGADYAAMSGSGSTLFGLFKDEVPTEDWDKDYFVWNTRL
jgi:4-diphosphocytidyl-2-C-methyl-D-erythritol kinase